MEKRPPLEVGAFSNAKSLVFAVPLKYEALNRARGLHF